ncbi:ribonuclease H-like domain-containing protein [Dendryphion nanum]|uniref:Ribonuclease H-like domain-containing protein n=1 Tax=Dendryphion nanum TaxID=256645 RepID=A0A9P9ECD0_9PLEO|nr:ribonuclease H-like domain-containing protein [Dendryphion nanum]
MSELGHAEPIAAEESSDDISTWPRPFRLQLGTETENTNAVVPKPCWDHTLYRGPNDEQVHVDYCTTKEQSEAAAIHFLDEAIVGFDMEWVIDWGRGPKRCLQDEVSMIQIASETRIALFHIGQHPGTTTEQLIAPSLRKIIESATIIKTGHNIMSADCGRLQKYFKITPRAIFELCHLHYLVSHGATHPRNVVHNIRGISLAKLVGLHLGHELSKDDDTRKGNWRRPLNDTREKDRQKKVYAAADAYAGVMLYHCLNAQRMAMDPTPPMPLLADDYLPFLGATKQPIRLQSDQEGETYTTAELFFKVKAEVKAEAQAGIKEDEKNKGRKGSSATPVPETPLDSTEKLLLSRLRERRGELAIKVNLPRYCVAQDSVLEDLARYRPLDEASLLKIKGIKKRKSDSYGAQLLEVIQDFCAENNLDSTFAAGTGTVKKASILHLPPTIDLPSAVVQPPIVNRPTTPDRNPRRRARSPGSSPAFGTPVKRMPSLHTGLSNDFSKTSIDLISVVNQDRQESSSGEDDVFMTPLERRESSQLKRKRSESPTPVHVQPPQPPTASTLNQETQLIRNKLLALSKRVIKLLNKLPVDPLVDEETLDQLALRLPQTKAQLENIPGAERFMGACDEANIDLLKNIIKFATGPSR